MPAARTERQVLAEPRVLNQQPRDVVGLDRRARQRPAQRLARDFLRGRHVPIEQCRRNRQHIGDVVEPVLIGIVGGQQRADVDLDAEEIADGVRVLGAVQAVHRRTAGIHVRRRPRDRAPIPVRVTNATAAAASGRGRPAGGIEPVRSFRDDLFPLAGVRANLRHVDGVQRQPRRLEPLVMARDAVSGQELPIEGERCLRGTRGALEGRQTGCSPAEPASMPTPQPTTTTHGHFCTRGFAIYIQCRRSLNYSSRAGPDRRLYKNSGETGLPAAYHGPLGSVRPRSGSWRCDAKDGRETSGRLAESDRRRHLCRPRRRDGGGLRHAADRGRQAPGPAGGHGAPEGPHRRERAAARRHDGASLGRVPRRCRYRGALLRAGAKANAATDAGVTPVWLACTTNASASGRPVAPGRRRESESCAGHGRDASDVVRAHRSASTR